MAAEDFIILNISGHEQLWCRSAPRALREERGMRLRMESGSPIAPLVCARLRLVSSSWVEFGYRRCAVHTLRTYNDALGDVRHVPRIDCGCDTRESLVRHGIVARRDIPWFRGRARGTRVAANATWGPGHGPGRRGPVAGPNVSGYKNEHKSRVS